MGKGIVSGGRKCLWLDRMQHIYLRLKHDFLISIRRNSLEFEMGFNGGLRNNAQPLEAQ
jgi:hypothetical protein